jgi:DDE superfamily endonuclease
LLKKVRVRLQSSDLNNALYIKTLLSILKKLIIRIGRQKNAMAFLKEEHKLKISYRSVIRWLHKENFALKVPRPWSDMQDEDIQVQRSRNIIICDNATWHKVKLLNWGQFEVLFLPPYSPDLNPIERFWQLL